MTLPDRHTTNHRPARAAAGRGAAWSLWLALLLAVFAALAPTVSHALNWAQGANTPLVEICTSTGPTWMAMGQPAESPDTTNPDPNPSTTLEHCPFCLLMADRAAPPPSWPAMWVASPGHAVVPDAPQLECLPARVLAAAHPRGPPAP